MSGRRRVDAASGMAALQSWSAGPEVADRATILRAVRFTLEELAARAPGQAVEVRVPPAGAVQVLPGVVHRRGTPPAVVEMSPETWLRLALGQDSWAEVIAAGAVQASGERADLTEWLPLFPGGDASPLPQ